MNAFNPEDLFIVVDGHHLVLLAKDEARSSDHLVAFKKVDYDPVKFASKKRANLGRTFDRMGVSRSLYSDSDPLKKDEINYLKEACKTIDVEFKRGGFSRIILIGESEIISILKKSMSKNMLAKVFREIYKNYSKVPLEVLERYLHTTKSAH